MIKKVCVQGLGFVGSAMCTAIASSRDSLGNVLYDVVGIDLDTEDGNRKISSINSGKLLFFCEDQLLKKKLEEASLDVKNLRASSDVNEYVDADIVIVDVDLSVQKQGISYSLPVVPTKSFELAIQTFAKLIKPQCLVIIETTVPPGTCKNIVRKIIKEEFSIRGIDSEPLICHSYERVMPGKNYLQSITHIHRNYSANSKEAEKLAKEFFENLIAIDEFPLTKLRDTTSSEIAKVLENSYRAMNIAFIQEWTELAEEMGINLFEVIDSIKKRKGTHDNMMKPGFGVGGYCLPKDALFAQWSLNNYHSDKKLKLPLTLQAIAINDKMPQHTFNRIKSEIHAFKGKSVLICGVSYMPDVADARNSPAKVLYDLIKAEGGICKVTDAILSDYGDGFLQEDVWVGENYNGFDVVVFAVKHSSYLNLDMNKFSQGLKPNCLVVDTFDIFNDDKIKCLLGAGLRVIGIGKGHIKELKELKGLL
jgi:UDP-N-acetyl-D-glucosamine dehydrogenase